MIRAPQVLSFAALLCVCVGVSSGGVLAQPAPQPQPTPKPVPTQAPTDAPQATVVAKAELIVLIASNDGSGIDAKIPNQEQLKKPPFSAYGSYRLAERADLNLPKGKVVERALPDKGKLTLTLEDVVTPKSPKDEPRYIVAASILKADGEKFLPRVQLNSKKGEWFFVAGQKFKDGIIVLGFRVIGS